MLRPSTFALLLSLTPILAACGASNPDGGQAPVLVETVMVSPEQGEGARFTGTIESRIESRLAFRVGGIITERLVNPGDVVRRGQPLMRIDPTDLALAAQSASQRVRAADADAVRAAADAKRLSGLVEAGAVSASDYDAAMAAERASAANRDAAAAAAREASNQRRYTTLVADADGVVTELLAQPGEVVAPGTPILRLARSGPREAAISVPETSLATLPRQATAQIYGDPKLYSASLREIGGAADPLTRSFAARFTVSGATPPVGATVTISFATPGTGSAVDVPLGALHDPGSGPGVWVVGRDSKVSFVPVKVVRLGNETASVTGLGRNLRIVALGAHLLHKGQAVRFTDRSGDRS